MSLKFLVVASETPDQQDARRAHSGEASHETYADTLRRLHGDCAIDYFCCVEGKIGSSNTALSAYDGIFFAGSPIQMYNDNDETRAAASFMQSVFQSGTPSFGSCAGLQIAAVASGGRAKPRGNGTQAGISRGIVPTTQERHPLLKGRPLTWDAVAMHSTIVERLAAGGTILAHAEGTPVEAAEIRSANSVFWGVQYHPEITLKEVAEALQRQASDLVDEGLAQDKGEIESYSADLKTLHDQPKRHDIAWQRGISDDVVNFQNRTTELRNFLSFISTC